MKVFMTGGSGFIGRHVVRKLLNRGVEINALIRRPEQAFKLEDLGVTTFIGNIIDEASMIPAMQGADVVFHIAGWYKIGAQQQQMAYPTNVAGTCNVFQLALRLGIPRIIYVSSIGIFGDTQGQIHDETYRMPAGQSFLTEYDRTKWLAYYEIAQPLIAKGANITVVIPGVVYGPGDPSLIGDLMRAYARGWLFTLPGPETMQCYAHVEDVAEGIILAYEKGKIGESYILAGPIMELWQVASLWAALIDRPMPGFSIASRRLNNLAGLASFLGRIFPLPALLSPDAARLVGASYIASAAKARQELGWRTRPVEIGFHETLTWFLQHQET